MKKYCLAVDVAKDDAMMGLFSPPSQNGEPIPITVMRKVPQTKDAVDRYLAEVRERADFSDVCCVMEATSVYHRALARYVSSLGMETKVINPIITGWHVCLKDIRAFDKTAFRPVFA